MLNEQLRKESEIYFSDKYDFLKLTNKEKIIIIKKIKTGKIGIIYFISFLTAGFFISYFSHQWLVSLLSFLIVLSTASVIFLNYQTEINLNTEEILFKKKFLFFQFNKNFSFHNILDFKIKEGEIGHYLKIQIGDNLGFINRLKSQWTLCRVNKYEDCVDLLNWLREIIKPK